jgi:hypothetical protein
LTGRCSGAGFARFRAVGAVAAAAAVTPSPIAVAGLVVGAGHWHVAGQILGCGNRCSRLETFGDRGGCLRFRLTGRPWFTRRPRLALSFARLARFARRPRLTTIPVAGLVALTVAALAAGGGWRATRRLLRIARWLRTLAIAGFGAAAFGATIAVLTPIAMLVATSIALIAPLAAILAPTARVALVAAFAPLVTVFTRPVDS